MKTTNKSSQATQWRRNYQSAFPWNQYQLDLFQAVSKAQSNIAINACAGSGKTSSIRGLIAALPASARIVVMAFNRHVADKLKEDPCIPQRITCNTAHGCGYSLLYNYWRGIQPIVDPRKYYNISKELVQKIINYRAEYDYDLFRLELNQIRASDLKRKWGSIPPPLFDESSLDGKMQLRLFIRFIRDVSQYAMKTLTPDDCEDSLKGMIEHYDLEFPEVPGAFEWGIRAVKHAIHQGEQIAIHEQVISFDEMLFLVYKWRITPWQKDYIIVDEAQDASPVQIALYQAFVNQGAKIIYIGDPRQSIMGFSGADTNSWQNLATEFHPQELPLSVCYRCPDSHLQLARRIVPQIETSPSAGHGTIAVLHPDEITDHAQPGDLIICRLTAPLISICLKLIIAGTTAIVRGRAIAEQLTSLAVNAHCGIHWPTQFQQNLIRYCSPLINQAVEDGDEATVEYIRDQQTALLTLFSQYKKLSHFEEFCNQVESLFCDDDAPDRRIILSTVHRAKGDEAERVFLVGTNFLPFVFKSTQDWQEIQEWNLVYVALTRAKNALFFVPYPRSDKDKEQLQDWLNDPLGGMELPNHFDPLDLNLGATIKAEGLEWELSGFDFEESGEIFLQLTRPENDTQIRVNSKDCQLIQNGTIQIPELPFPVKV
ncbi:MAG: UvrD-helicase domain-containing protein [Cyanobacteria bacterium J06592_8]